ncbi:MAG: hypothetical protein AAF658_07960 [Myxococcota bacterium]
MRNRCIGDSLAPDVARCDEGRCQRPTLRLAAGSLALFALAAAGENDSVPASTAIRIEDASVRYLASTAEVAVSATVVNSLSTTLASVVLKVTPTNDAKAEGFKVKLQGKAPPGKTSLAGSTVVPVEPKDIDAVSLEILRFQVGEDATFEDLSTLATSGTTSGENAFLEHLRAKPQISESLSVSIAEELSAAIPDRPDLSNVLRLLAGVFLLRCQRTENERAAGNEDIQKVLAQPLGALDDAFQELRMARLVDRSAAAPLSALIPPNIRSFRELVEIESCLARPSAPELASVPANSVANTQRRVGSGEAPPASASSAAWVWWVAAGGVAVFGLGIWLGGRVRK